MKKLTQFIKSCFRYFGFDIIRSLDNKIDFRVLDANFENLARNYENLFGEKYGRIPGNEIRIGLMKNLLSIPSSEAYFLVRFLYASKDIEGSETVEMFESMEFSVIEKYFFQPEYPLHANKFFIKKLRTIAFFHLFMW